MYNKVAIITINYNQASMTIECMLSVLASDYENYTVILIDNGSDYKNFQQLVNAFNHEDKVKVFRIEKNCGYVGGVNHGLHMATKMNPDYFLIMNNDTIIDKFAITELVKTSDKYKQKAIVSGKVYHFDRPDVIQYTGSYFYNKKYFKETYPGRNEKDIRQCDEDKERDMLDDIFWLLPKQVLKNVGYYADCFFIYAEQADYALRAIKVGYKLIYTPKAKLWHKGCLTTGNGDKDSPAIAYWRNKSSVIFLFRNMNKSYFILLIVKKLTKHIVKNILNLFKLRKTSHSKSDFAAFIGSFAGLKWTIFKKKDHGYNPFNIKPQ